MWRERLFWGVPFQHVYTSFILKHSVSILLTLLMKSKLRCFETFKSDSNSFDVSSICWDSFRTFCKWNSSEERRAYYWCWEIYDIFKECLAILVKSKELQLQTAYFFRIQIDLGSNLSGSLRASSRGPLPGCPTENLPQSSLSRLQRSLRITKLMMTYPRDHLHWSVDIKAMSNDHCSWIYRIKETSQALSFLSNSSANCKYCFVFSIFCY